MTAPFGLYGPGMHEFVLIEMELGTRAAIFQDNEDCGWSALDDLSYDEYMREHGEQEWTGIQTLSSP